MATHREQFDKIERERMLAEDDLFVVARDNYLKDVLPLTTLISS